MMNEADEIQNDLYSSKFSGFFKTKLAKSLIKLEKRRIRLLIISFAIIFLLIISIIYNIYSGNFEDNIDSIIIFTVIAVMIISWNFHFYKFDVKSSVLEKLLSFVGDFRQIIVEEDTVYVKSLNLFDKFDNYSCDDRIKGKYGLLDIDIQEIELSVGKGKYTRSVFKGILIKIPIRKKFNGYTVIKRNSKRVSNKINVISSENTMFEFNEYYDISSENDLETRCLLTESFMEKMVRIAKHNIGGNISISFENRNVNIAVASNKNWFEVPIFKSATNIENYRGILLEFTTLLKIIDSLKLEQNIGL